MNDFGAGQPRGPRPGSRSPARPSLGWVRRWLWLGLGASWALVTTACGGGQNPTPTAVISAPVGSPVPAVVSPAASPAVTAASPSPAAAIVTPSASPSTALLPASPSPSPTPIPSPVVALSPSPGASPSPALATQAESGTVIRDYFAAITRGDTATAQALLAPPADRLANTGDLEALTTSIQQATVESLTLVDSAPTRQVYRADLAVTPRAGQAGNWNTGANTRWITLILTSGGWRIAGITSSPPS